MTPVISVLMTGSSSVSPGSSNARPPPLGIFALSNGRLPSPSISSATASFSSPVNVTRLKFFSVVATSFFAIV